MTFKNVQLGQAAVYVDGKLIGHVVAESRESRPWVGISTDRQFTRRCYTRKDAAHDLRRGIFREAV